MTSKSDRSRIYDLQIQLGRANDRLKSCAAEEAANRKERKRLAELARDLHASTEARIDLAEDTLRRLEELQASSPDVFGRQQKHACLVALARELAASCSAGIDHARSVLERIETGGGE